MTTRALLFTIFAAAFSAAASYFGATYAVAVLERETVATAQTSLHAAGNDWALVRADGLRVTLSGRAPDESARFSALEVTGRVIDTDRIVDQMDVASAVPQSAPDFRLAIVRNDGKLSLIGLVPGQETRETTLSRLAAIDATEVTDLIEAVDYTPPVGWHAALNYALAAAARLERSQISLSPNSVEVMAFLPTPADRAALEAELATYERPDLDVALTISTPKPVVAPFVFAAVRDTAGLSVSACTFDSSDAFAAVSARLKEAQDHDCTIALGAPSPKWGAAVDAALAALETLGAGKVTLSDADISLTGPVGGDPDAFAAATETLTAALPPIFSLTTNLPPPPSDDSSDQPAPRLVFTTKLDPETGVTLVGPLRDDRARAAVRNFAAALFGHGRVTDQTETASDVGDGWTQRVLTSLEAMADMHEATIDTYVDEIAIEGTVIEETAQDRLLALLNERIDPASITHSIAYKPEIKVMIEAPTPAECAAKLKMLLAGSQIVFAPNSADISGESGLLLDEIAKVIRSCPNARFEIGGHTDSQGREEMNLALSQSRAEAVLDSLLAREVLLDFVTARGYGETLPIASNDDDAGRAINRRIEFTLISETEADADGAAADQGEGEGASTDGSRPATDDKTETKEP